MEQYERRDLKEEIYHLVIDKPAIASTNDYVNKLYAENKDKFDTEGRRPLKVVGISDLHIDYGYTAGASNDCGRPLCCRGDSGKPTDPSQAAGKWGDFKCDLNSITLDSMLAHIKNVIKPDLVLWGGDSIPHNVDSLTEDRNIQIMELITKQVRAGLDGIKIYPCIGNHDTYPQDVINMQVPHGNEAINKWSPAWDDMIKDPEQIKNWRDWNYFVLPFEDSQGNAIGATPTKIISINSNICYQFNWWSAMQFEDPGNMLGWLESELSALEAVNG